MYSGAELEVIRDIYDFVSIASCDLTLTSIWGYVYIQKLLHMALSFYEATYQTKFVSLTLSALN